MTAQEKVEKILTEHSMEDILQNHRADTAPFLEFAFDALGTKSEEKREFFSRLLDESMVHYALEDGWKDAARDQASFLMLALTGLEGVSVSELITSAPGYVLFRAVSLFIEAMDPEEKEKYDPDEALRWNLLARTMYISHFAADPKTDIAEPFLHHSLSCCWIWYSGENWDALLSIAEDTLLFGKEYLSKTEANVPSSVSMAVLLYLKGTALSEGKEDKEGMLTCYRESMEIIRKLPVEVQNEMVEMKTILEKSLEEAR